MEIFNKVRDCKECPFRQNGFTFYVNHAFNYEFMLLLQNPNLEGKDREESREVEKAHTPDERVKIHQRYISKWFLSTNKRFMERFLEEYKRCGILDYEDFEKYIEDHLFFNDFYVTDLIKYRCKTTDIKIEHLEHAMHEHLIDEVSIWLQKAAKPRLILVFGTRVWEVFRKHFDLEPCQELETKTDPDRGLKVSNVHGFIFQGKLKPVDRKPESVDYSFFAIPLSHMSPNARYKLLRNSYFQYFREGLQYYASLRNKFR